MNVFTDFSGGPMFWLVCLLGVVAVCIFVSRWLALRRARVDYTDFIAGVTNVLAKGNDAEALSICEYNPVPLSAIVSAAISNRKGSPEALREAVDATGRVEVGRLERRIAPLASVAQIAPLLGLLGTIWGLVDVARTLNDGVLISQVELMRSVIGTLKIAGAGLTVAIPAQIMHEILCSRIDRIAADLEAAASRIVAFVQSPEVKG